MPAVSTAGRPTSASRTENSADGPTQPVDLDGEGLVEPGVCGADRAVVERCAGGRRAVSGDRNGMLRLTGSLRSGRAGAGTGRSAPRQRGTPAPAQVNSPEIARPWPVRSRMRAAVRVSAIPAANTGSCPAGYFFVDHRRYSMRTASPWMTTSAPAICHRNFSSDMMPDFQAGGDGVLQDPHARLVVGLDAVGGRCRVRRPVPSW